MLIRALEAPDVAVAAAGRLLAWKRGGKPEVHLSILRYVIPFYLEQAIFHETAHLETKPRRRRW
jgi:hypothetical protein